MTYDDLHLIRPFSALEIRSAWWGGWDPDGIENSGLRPLTLLFNHCRYFLFGENVVGHRLFLVGALALYLTLGVSSLRPLVRSLAARLLAGVLVIVSRFSVYHYVWLTDGLHLMQGLSFLAAWMGLLRFIRGGSPLWLIGAWFCVVAGALVREDTMATVPLLWLLGFLVQRRDSPARGQGRLLLFAAGSVLLAAVLLAWRAVAVPDAVSLGFDLGGYAVSVLRAFQIAGDELEGIAGRWALAWLFSLAGLAAVASFARRRMAGVTVSVAAVAIAATPTLVFGRRNLLFFAVSASAVGIALLALEVWEIGSRPAKVLACLALACGIGGGVWASRTFALHFHPYSVSSLEWTAQFIFGPASSRATIPAQRRAEAFRRLRSLGIRGADYESAVENLKAEAEAANRARPTQPGLPFSPAIRNVW